MKISDEARARLLSTTSNLLDHKGVDHLASGLMQKTVRSDADDSDGHWVTTEEGNHMFINGEGVPTKGNPHVLAAARGEKGPKKASTKTAGTGKKQASGNTASGGSKLTADLRNYRDHDLPEDERQTIRKSFARNLNELPVGTEVKLGDTSFTKMRNGEWKNEKGSTDAAGVLRSMEFNDSMYSKEGVQIIDHRSPVDKQRDERGGVAQKMYEAGEIPQDTMGILDSMNYSDKIMDRAVERGWITKEQAGKIKGESQENASGEKAPERRTISAHGGEKGYKISVGDSCQSLLDKPTSEVTYSDTRKAIAEFKDEFKKAVEAAKEYKKIGTFEASFGASDIRDTFQEYAKEMRKKFADIEKNANKKTSEGRIAAKDASDFLWNNAGCDVEKIYTYGFGDWTKM